MESRTLMKKTLMVIFALGIVLYLGSASAADFSLHDSDGFQYDCTYVKSIYPGANTGEVRLYNMVVFGVSVGWLILQPDWGNAFKITVLENDLFWGWTIEGHWQGDGTLAFGVSNNGLHYDTTVYRGPLAPGTAVEPFANEK